jgi:hypothetical protein
MEVFDDDCFCESYSVKNEFLQCFYDQQLFDDYLMSEIATEITLMNLFQVGYRVLGVQPNSPAAVGGLVSFFDFIVAANGIPLGTLDSTFVDLIKVTLPIYCLHSFSLLIPFPNSIYSVSLFTIFYLVLVVLFSISLFICNNL